MPPIPPEQQSPFGNAAAAEDTISNVGPVLLPARRVLARYGGIHETTLWRWINDGTFPPPDRIINHRRYWWSSTLDAFDREAS